MTFSLHSNRIPCGRSAISCAVSILGVVLAGHTVAATTPARTFGDRALRAEIDVKLNKIYELANGPGTQVEWLTKENPLLLENALGTELSATMIGGSPGRIIATVWTSRGKYSIEFYRADNQLLMVYETFSFFAESAPPDAWHNFMGLPAWEGRIYYAPGGKVGYAEMRGPQAPPPEIAGKRLLQQAQCIVDLLARSPAHWDRK